MVKSGSINGFPFGYQKKAVHPTIRNAKSETPGKYGSSIDQLKEGGLDITVDVIAQSTEERDAIVEAFMQAGRGRLYPGNPDSGWYYSGVCGDRSSDFRLSEFNPSVTYPLSFRFDTDLPFQLSDDIKTCGKQILADGQTWSSGDSIAFNCVQNEGFESWTAHTGYDTPDGWILQYTPGSGFNAEVLQSSVHKFGSKCLNLKNTNNTTVFGVIYQQQYFEPNVEYTFGAWVYTDTYSNGHITVELYNGSQAVTSTSCGPTSDFTLITGTYTFTTTPSIAWVCVYVRGQASSSTNHYVDSVFCVKSSDFSNIETYGSFIQTSGTVETVPDIQIDGPLLDSNITPLAQETQQDLNPYSKNITQIPIIDSAIYSQDYAAPVEASNLNEYRFQYPVPVQGQDAMTVAYSISQGDSSIHSVKSINIPAVNDYLVDVSEIGCTIWIISGARIAVYFIDDEITTPYILSTMFDPGSYGANGYLMKRTFSPTVRTQPMVDGTTVSVSAQSQNTNTSSSITLSQFYVNYSYYPQTFCSTVVTLTIPGESGFQHVLTSFKFDGHCENGNTALYKITMTTPKVNNGTETELTRWSTSSSVYVTANFNAADGEANEGDDIVLKYYMMCVGNQGGYVYLKNCKATYVTLVPADTNALCTIQITPSLGQTNTLTLVKFQGKVTAGSVGYYTVKIQNAGLYGGVETAIGLWATSSNTFIDSTVWDFNFTGNVTSSTYITFYGTIQGTTGGTVSVQNCEARYGVSEDFGLPITTLTVPGTVSGGRTITEYGYQFRATNSGNAADIKVTIQHGSGTETQLSTFSTISTALVNKIYTNQTLTGTTNTPIYLRFYGKLANGYNSGLYLTNCFANYVGGFVIPTGLLQNVNIYNLADPYTKLNLCSVLQHGSSSRINADDTGFFRHRDNYKTNSYLSVISPSSSGLSWVYSQLTIVSGGSLIYTFDTRYPIDGVPYLILGVNSGNPQISIAINENGVAGTFYTIDGNLTTVPTGVNSFNLINFANCKLSEATNISIRISPPTGTSCAIGLFEFFSYLLTVDAERPTLTTGGTNTFAIEMTDDALCNISIGYNDRKWGI
jgi:hypothetical protein